jgi:hypothetical protein
MIVNRAGKLGKARESGRLLADAFCVAAKYLTRWNNIFGRERGNLDFALQITGHGK